MDLFLSEDSNFDNRVKSFFKNSGFSSFFFTLKANKSSNGRKNVGCTFGLLEVVFDVEIRGYRIQNVYRFFYT